MAVLEMRSPIVIDLFTGGGGFALGASQAGFSVALAIDVDQDLTYSHHENFSRTHLLNVDVTQLDPRMALDTANLKPGKFAGVIGGPPCQGFSYIGLRNPDDARNHLVRNFFHFVLEAEPAFFVMENVAGILSEKSHKLLDDAMADVSGKYDFVGPLVLDAADYGAATVRPRAIIVGYSPERMDPIFEQDLRSTKVLSRTNVYEAMHDLPNLTSAIQREGKFTWAKYDKEPDLEIFGEYARVAREEPSEGLATQRIREAWAAKLVSGYQLTNHTKEVVKRFRTVAQGTRDAISKCPRLDWSKSSPALRAGTGKDRGSYQAIRPIHPDQDRVITVREAARIQGFPDWFQFHPTKWHSFRMIGNSISPYLSKAILRVIADRIETPVDIDQAA